MSNGIQEIDQEMLSTIKRHSGVGMAVGIFVVLAGVLALISPFLAGLSVAIAVPLRYSTRSITSASFHNGLQGIIGVATVLIGFAWILELVG